MSACEPLVSIQLSTAADPVSGHLSWGALVDQDRVLVPAPLDWLLDPQLRFEVLLASARREGPGVIERLQVDNAEIIGSESEPSQAIGALQLSRPSTHKSIVGAAVSAAAITAALETGSPPWAALTEVGLLPTGILDVPVAEALSQVQQWEHRRRRDLVRQDLYPSAALGGIKFCCLVHRCPCDCPGQWW